MPPLNLEASEDNKKGTEPLIIRKHCRVITDVERKGF